MNEPATPELIAFHDLLLNSLRVLGVAGVIVTSYRLSKRAFNAVARAAS